MIESEQPNIQIELDKQEYEQGEKLNGVIKLQVHQRLIPQSLVLKFKAKEDVYWKIEDIVKGKRRRKEYRARVTWFNHKFPLVEYLDETLEAGTYEYPFFFFFDDNHPISFHFVKLKDKSIPPEIEVDMLEEEYNIHVLTREQAKKRGWLPGYPGMDFSRKNKDLITRVHSITKLKCVFQANREQLQGLPIQSKQSHFIQIVQSAKRISEIIPIQIQRITQSSLISCFCMKKGSVNLQLELAKNSFLCGEEIKVKVMIDNTNSALSYYKLIITHQIRKILALKDHNEAKKIIIDIPSITEQKTHCHVGSGQKGNNCEAGILVPQIENSINLKIFVSCYELLVIGDYGLGDGNPRVTANIWIYSSKDQQMIQVQQLKQEQQLIMWSKNLYYEINSSKTNYSKPVWQLKQPQKQINNQFKQMVDETKMNLIQ